LSQASQSSIEHVLVESCDDLIAKENDELKKEVEKLKILVCFEGEEQSATFSR
jgi:cell division GTPase FtsZ